MALRFQNSDDDVDRAAKEARATSLLILLVLLFAAISGVFAWVTGESLASYAKDLTWWFGFGLAYWIAAPFYYEFRIRAREIDGKVSAIEKALVADGQAKLIEQLETLDAKLDSLREVMDEKFDSIRG